MNKNFLLIFLLIGVLFFLSCDEGNEVIYERNAKLIWTGDYEVDGCGFFVEIDSTEYKPENEGIIPPEFKSYDTLSITVQYIDLFSEIELQCFRSPITNKKKAIKLISIDLNWAEN